MYDTSNVRVIIPNIEFNDYGLPFVLTDGWRDKVGMEFLFSADIDVQDDLLVPLAVLSSSLKENGKIEKLTELTVRLSDGVARTMSFKCISSEIIFKEIEGIAEVVRAETFYPIFIVTLSSYEGDELVQYVNDVATPIDLQLFAGDVTH